MALAAAVAALAELDSDHDGGGSASFAGHVPIDGAIALVGGGLFSDDPSIVVPAFHLDRLTAATLRTALGFRLRRLVVLAGEEVLDLVPEVHGQNPVWKGFFLKCHSTRDQKSSGFLEPSAMAWTISRSCSNIGRTVSVRSW